MIHSFRNILPELWGSFLFNDIRDKNGNVYGPGFLKGKIQYASIWIAKKDELPKKSSIRLWSENKCVFCNASLSFKISVGDHSVGKGMDELCWSLPCCKNCNSSKGTTKINKDLITWWIGNKNKSILQIKRDVLSIFVRARFRQLELCGDLDKECPKEYLIALKQLRDAWLINKDKYQEVLL